MSKEYSTGILVTHPDIDPIKQGLTSVNRLESMFPFGASRVRRRVRAVSFGPTNYELCTHICISESPQETRFYASRFHEFKNDSNCQLFFSILFILSSHFSAFNLEQV